MTNSVREVSVGEMRDGAELLHLVATQRITSEHPGTRALILTTFDFDEYVYDALRTGASGFLLKDVTASRLVGGSSDDLPPGTVP
ncbi:response regulator transcription factor [Sanguibacter suarezii]|uniref:response regulator transcription factor n=1 Tax=Sanguibacter suarezii TaxID=60921 RepID=UPI000833BEEC